MLSNVSFREITLLQFNYGRTATLGRQCLKTNLEKIYKLKKYHFVKSERYPSRVPRRELTQALIKRMPSIHPLHLDSTRLLVPVDRLAQHELTCCFRVNVSKTFEVNLWMPRRYSVLVHLAVKLVPAPPRVKSRFGSPKDVYQRWLGFSCCHSIPPLSP